MSTNNNNTECMITCWGIAAFVGVVAMVMLYTVADFDATQAIFTGGLVGTVLGLVLSLTVCRSQSSADDLASEDKPAMRYAAQAAAEKAERAAAAGTSLSGESVGAAGIAAGTAGVAAGSAGAAPGSAGTTPGTAGDVSGVAPSATNRSASVGGPEAGTVPAGAVDTSAPTGTTAAVSGTPASASSTDARTASAKTKDAPKAKKKPAVKAKAAPKAAASTPAAADDARPAALLDAPRAGGADDLKLISGVGPKLEQTLNDLGVYHFDQVAKFKKDDIEWVDARLRFKGRIERDDWMSQARILAEGGETEFSKGKKKS